MITITGATGHIGNVLVRQLLDKGEHIRVLVLPDEDLTPIKSLNVEVVTGNICDIDSLVQAFNGADMVYHLAGMITILPGKKDNLYRVNVNGTKNVVEACLKTGVRRLVYTSSIHAIKELPHGSIIDESQPFDPVSVLGDYAKSKALASMEVLQGTERGLDAVIVCPTGVIGPYDYRVSEMGKLFLDFLNKKLIARVDGAYDFVDVRDVASGLILAGEKGYTGECYILSGERITINDLMSLLEKLSGTKAPLMKIPSYLARIMGIIATPFYLITKTRPLFTAYSIDVLNSNSLINSAKARRVLGFSSRPLKESVSDSISWFAQESRQRITAGKFKNVYRPAL
jgi:dihydroflavonol-4-reductase